MRTSLPTLALVVAGCTITATAQTARPILEESSLVVGSREARSIRVYEETFREIEAGGFRIRLGESFVARVDETDEELWRVALEGMLVPRYVGAHDGVALFAVTEVGRSNQRLDLETGAWIPQIEFEPPPPSVCTTEGLIAEPFRLLSESDGCFILLGWRREGENADLAAIYKTVFDCYSIVSLDHGWTTTRWVHHEPSRGVRPGAPDPPLRWPVGGTTPVPPAHSLAHTGFGLVACTGERSDILCLDPTGGEIVWRLERLWEFDRGYVGPSCFNYFVARFGDDYMRSFPDPDKTAVLHQEFEKRYSGAIAGELVVVPKREDRTRAGEALLIVVERGPPTYLCETLAESRVYEIDSLGDPVAVAPLPRKLLDGISHRDRRGVTWAGAEGSFLHCSASDNDGEVSMGPGWASECVARIDWCRELSWDRIVPWLRSEPYRDAIAFGAGYVLRPAAGMYVDSPDEMLVHFPIWRFHLDDQRAELLDLRIPTEMEIPEPGGNFERVGWRYRIFGPGPLRLGDLDAVDGRLRVTLETDEWVRMVEYDLRNLDD